MKRSLRFALVLGVALALAPFLPLYVERTMVRSWRADHAGDVVEWGWRICTLSSYWSDYRHLRPEQNPAFWLAVNLSLALAYALLMAFTVHRIFQRRWL